MIDTLDDPAPRRTHRLDARGASLRAGALALALALLALIAGRVAAGPRPLARLALLAAAGALALRAPSLALALLVVVLAPFGPHQHRGSLSIAAPLSETLVAVFLVAHLARLVRRAPTRCALRPLDAALVASLAAAACWAVAALLARGPAAATAASALTLDAALFVDSPLGPCFPLRRLYTLIEGLALYACARTLRRDQVRALLPWLAVALAVVASFGLAQHVLVDTSWRFRGLNRALSFLPGPNSLGSLLALLLPCAWLVARRPADRAERLIAWIALAAGLAALALTRSRGAWLSLALAPPAWLLLARLARRRPRAASLALPAAALAATLALTTALSLSAAAPAAWHERLNTASSGRYLLYLGAAQMLRDRPLTGVGLGNFDLRLADSYPRWVVPREPHDHAHSLYFQLLAEQGLVGGLPLLLGLGLLLGAAARNAARDALASSLALACLTLLLHDALDHTSLVVVLALHFWLLAGLLASQAQPLVEPGAEAGGGTARSGAPPRAV